MQSMRWKLSLKGTRCGLWIRRGSDARAKTHLMAEKLSVIMARRHLEAADVALLVIDATEGVTWGRMQRLAGTRMRAAAA